nr:zinc-binding alcohol dehydrogenase [uncultured Flavobacterium sp.]
MRKVVVEGKLGVKIIETKEPICKEGQLKIKNAITLISPGTEIHYINLCTSNNTNLSLGYCASGYVTEIGKGVAEFSVGDRVIAMGWNYATHSEVICVPYKLCVKIPYNLSFENAVFANLNATALHAIDRANILVQDNILIIGSGLVGQLIAQSCKLITSDVTIMDYSLEKLEVASYFGINTLHLTEKEFSLKGDYKKFTKIFLCFSGEISNKIFAEYIKAMNSFGNGVHRSSITIVGRFNSDIFFSVDMGNIDIKYAARCGEGYRNDDYAHGNTEIRVVPGEHTVTENLLRSVKTISDGQIKLKKLISGVYSFDHASEVYKLIADSKSSLGILFKYE